MYSVFLILMVEIKSPDPDYSKEKQHKLKLPDLAQETKNNLLTSKIQQKLFFDRL